MDFDDFKNKNTLHIAAIGRDFMNNFKLHFNWLPLCPEWLAARESLAVPGVRSITEQKAHRSYGITF